jgi:hypothetical protein
MEERPRHRADGDRLGPGGCDEDGWTIESCHEWLEFHVRSVRWYRAERRGARWWTWYGRQVRRAAKISIEHGEMRIEQQLRALDNMRRRNDGCRYGEDGSCVLPGSHGDHCCGGDQRRERNDDRPRRPHDGFDECQSFDK